ncbi:MAG: helix-hairpin-helix domain-containing protein [Oscillospiraceae bacterium]|nr:helix-hairpin-helix domain-containing protein [Oscillospiraceae bacterium]
MIAKIAKIGTGAAVAAAVVVGFCVADRSPRESAVVLSSIPESSVSAEYKSPAISGNSANVESSPGSETSQKSETRNTDETKPYLVNINTATSRQLQTLSGIGEAKAAAIIEYRETHGGFSDVSELLNVSGIGETIFGNIRDYVTVGDAPPKETPPPDTSKPSSASSTSTPTAPAQIPVVNINTASVEELQMLPGIGSAKALAIVQYRSVCGEFYDISDIKNVSGIGESVFAEIREFITVGNVSPRPVENTPQAPEIHEEIYLDLNTAKKSELCKIPGIGEVKAQAIIDYREANGGFYSIEEIKNVSGIGDKTFESIRDYIYVEYRERPGNNQNPEEPVQSESAVNYPVNLNTATLEELCTLPTIDEEKARAIIQFRIDHEGFNDIRELQNIDGLDIGTVYILRYIITV